MSSFFKKSEAIKSESVERTFGHFPSAQEIRLAERKKVAAKECESLQAVHRTMSSPTSPPPSDSPPRLARARTQATISLQSSFPITRRFQPTTSSPAHNRAYGANVTPLFNPRYERSKTDFMPSMKVNVGSELSPSHPEIQTDRGPDRTPYFLTELQLPKLENRKSAFRNTVAIRPRHHMVHPDWISEGMIIKRLRVEHRSNPLLYGWI